MSAFQQLMNFVMKTLVRLAAYPRLKRRSELFWEQVLCYYIPVLTGELPKNRFPVDPSRGHHNKTRSLASVSEPHQEQSQPVGIS